MSETPRICDYEGSNYRTEFWEGQGRNYEDLVERRILRKLLPASGQRLLELGAGFGRLSQEYRGYQTIVLLDYSFSQLQYARERLGDEGYLYVAADAYRLPFQAGVFDAATMIRVIHHFEDVPRVLSGIRRVLADDAAFLLEFANKRNLKALLRHRLGRQAWNPNDPDPVEFVELNYNFHPQMIHAALERAGFAPGRRIPASFLRVGALKRSLPAAWLANADELFQRSGWMVAPSIFTLNQVQAQGHSQLSLPNEEIFACPENGTPLKRTGDLLTGAPDGPRWAVREGIYDFKTSV